MAERITYRVYHAPEGCDPSYCGEYDDRDEAAQAAAADPRGLEQSLWDTARAAGHCAGLTAPDDGEESEPLSWHGSDGCYCVVEVRRDGCAD